MNAKAAAESKAMGDWTYIGFPRKVDAYRAFVTRVVSSLNGDGEDDVPGLKQGIKYWQIENEWDWRWQDSPEQFVEFLKIAYETVKAVDPGATVVLGGISNITRDAFVDGYIDEEAAVKGQSIRPEDLRASQEFMKLYNFRRYVLEHGSDYFDVISFHQYGQRRFIEANMQWLRGLMRRSGYSRPVWITEAGGPYIARDETYTEELHAQEVIKYYVGALASGVSVIFWSSYLSTPEWGPAFVNTALLDQDGRKKPAFYAYRLMTEQLSDAVQVQRLIGAPQAQLVKFTRSGHVPVYVLWKEGDAALPQPWQDKIRSRLGAKLAGSQIKVTTYSGKSHQLEAGRLAESWAKPASTVRFF